MPTEQEKKPEVSSNEEKKPLKPCCACPETKQPRDACIMENGEENCQDLIEAHKKCMRDLGFKIWGMKALDLQPLPIIHSVVKFILLKYDTSCISEDYKSIALKKKPWHWACGLFVY